MEKVWCGGRGIFFGQRVEVIKMDGVVRDSNHANLKKLDIDELQEMLKDHAWNGEVISVSPDLKLLICSVLEKRMSRMERT